MARVDETVGSDSSGNGIIIVPNNNKNIKIGENSRALTAPGDFRRKKGVGGSGRVKSTKRQKILKNLRQHSLSDGDVEQQNVDDELNENKEEIDKKFNKKQNGGDIRVEIP